MAGSSGRVVALALASRAAVLVCMLIADWSFQDLDTSARLQGSPCAAAPAAAAAAASGAGQGATQPRLAVWDTVYFARVAQCGYETDKINAFFPLMPAVMRYLGGAVARLAQLTPEASFTLAGLAINLAAFCLAAACLHRLASRHLCDRRLADLSLLFFCCNPASIFYSAAYSESLFAACTWLGLLLLPSNHWAAIAALATAAAARSNGILGVWFPLHKLLVSCRKQRRLLFGQALQTILSCIAIMAPYAAMQVQAYMTHCMPASQDSWHRDGLPAWCNSRLPSVYGYIQREYWDVGFLRFYRDPSRLPMVLMSVPVAWLSISGCWAYFAADWQRALTLGLYSKRQKLPAWLVGPAALVRHGLQAVSQKSTTISHLQGSGGRRRQAPATAMQQSTELAPLIYHWALMTAVALLAMHVNVATRFLSACPPLYFYAAQLLAGGGTRSRLLWLWCFSYIALGCLLFPNFYPWT